MCLAVFDDVLLQREVAVCGLGRVHRQTCIVDVIKKRNNFQKIYIEQAFRDHTSSYTRTAQPILHKNKKRLTGLHAEGSEFIPVGGAVSIVVDLVEHFLQHGDGVRSFDVLDDARVRLEQLLEQHLQRK